MEISSRVFLALRAYMWYWKLSSALPACSLWESTYVEDIVQCLTYSQCLVDLSGVCKYTHVCLSQRRMASVFLICFPSYFLRQDLSLNRELVDLASLAVLGQSPSTSVTVVSTSPGFFFFSNVGTELKFRFFRLAQQALPNWANSQVPTAQFNLTDYY